MDVFIDEELDEEEQPDEVPELVIDDGEAPRRPRTIFVDQLPNNFEMNCKNIFAATKVSHRNL